MLVAVSGAANGALDTGRGRVALLVVAGGGAAAWLAARVRRRLEADAARLDLLVALSGVGTGATVEQAAARLGDLVVPAVADVCVIERAGEEGRRRILCVRVAGAAAGVEERLHDVGLLAGRADAAVEREPVLLEPVTDEVLRAAAPDDAGLGLLRSLRLRSVVSAPLFARGRTVGLLHMGVGTSGRRYGARDLRFAEVVAGRVALALENAGLSAELLDAEVTMDEPRGLAAVLRGDVPHFVTAETPDEALVAYAVDGEHLALLREVGFNSIMIVPVPRRSAILAALTFVSAQARRFDAADLELALELGRRAGIALENAAVQRARRHRAHAAGRARAGPDPAGAGVGRGGAVPPGRRGHRGGR